MTRCEGGAFKYPNQLLSGPAHSDTAGFFRPIASKKDDDDDDHAAKTDDSCIGRQQPMMFFLGIIMIILIIVVVESTSKIGSTLCPVQGQLLATLINVRNVSHKPV
jgi:hypothetical protein